MSSNVDNFSVNLYIIANVNYPCYCIIVLYVYSFRLYFTIFTNVNCICKFK